MVRPVIVGYVVLTEYLGRVGTTGAARGRVGATLSDACFGVSDDSTRGLVGTSEEHAESTAMPARATPPLYREGRQSIGRRAELGAEVGRAHSLRGR
jgi:hypothetical protein